MDIDSFNRGFADVWHVDLEAQNTFYSPTVGHSSSLTADGAKTKQCRRAKLTASQQERIVDLVNRFSEQRQQASVTVSSAAGCGRRGPSGRQRAVILRQLRMQQGWPQGFIGGY